MKKQREFYHKLGMEVPGDIKGETCSTKQHLDSHRNGKQSFIYSVFGGWQLLNWLTDLLEVYAWYCHNCFLTVRNRVSIGLLPCPLFVHRFFFLAVSSMLLVAKSVSIVVPTWGLWNYPASGLLAAKLHRCSPPSCHRLLAASAWVSKHNLGIVKVYSILRSWNVMF